MYCKKCGKIIDNDSVYCKYCGRKLEFNKINITLIDIIKNQEVEIELEDCSIINLFSFLIKNKYIPTSKPNNMYYTLYLDDDNIFIQNNKSNPEFSNTLVSDIIKEKQTKTFYIYYESRNEYFNARDMRCLYGCPGSNKVQERANIEAMNFNKNFIEVICDE